MKTILILGGGIGGIVTARELRRHLGLEHRIIIIDQNAVHSFPPSYLWIMVGWRKPDSIERPLTLLENHHIEFHHGKIVSIDPAGKKVVADNRTFNCDYLVVALGAEPTEKNRENGNGGNAFYTKEGAIILKEKISAFYEGTIAIVIPDLSIKFPPAAYEAAFLLESFFSKRNIKNVTINLFTPENSPLQFSGKPASAGLSALVKERGIGLFTSHNLISVGNNTIEFDGSRKYRYDLLLKIPRHAPPGVVLDAGLADRSGWIGTNKMMQTRFQNVFAIGDITALPMQNGHPLPKTGLFALNQAEIVAYNIAHEIQKSGSRKEFTGSGFIIIEYGNGRAVNLHGDFLASPEPEITLNEPNVTFHWGKVVIEKYWLWRWF